MNSNNKKKGNVAVGVYSAHTNNKKNGVIYSVYLQANENVNLNNESIKDLVTEPVVDRLKNAATNEEVQHNEPKKIEVTGTPLQKDAAAAGQNTTTVVDYKYKLGDVDGDGKISLEDAQACCSLIYDAKKDDYISLNVNQQLSYEDNASALFKGVFVSTDYYGDAKRCELKVADIDKNGVVNFDDARLILRYYTNVGVSGNGYGNPYGLGKVIEHKTNSAKFNRP